MRRPLVLTLTAALAASMAVGVAGNASAELPSQAAPAAAEAVPDELLVAYVAGATEASKARARGRAAANLVEVVVPASAARRALELVRVPAGTARADAVRALEQDPAVDYAQPNWVYRKAGKPGSGTTTTATTTALTGATDTYFADGRLWGMQSATPTAGLVNPFASQAVATWTGQQEPTTVYVGVIDEGAKTDHPDLAGQFGRPNEPLDGKDNDGNGKVDDALGWDFVNNDRTVYDGGKTGSADNHGTHVSGTIAAKADGKGVVGVAPYSVKLISAKFLGRNGGTTANAVKAVEYFTDLKGRGINVVATSNSWGGGGFDLALRNAIGYGARAGVLFIAAAGNNGTDNSQGDYYPADYTTLPTPWDEGKRVTADYNAVVAVAAHDSAGNKASFSNFGAPDVHVTAPGVGVWSTTANNGGYSSYNGTSMATPHVTGAVALYAARAGFTTTTQVEASAIRDALTSSAAPTAIDIEHGRLDVAAMLLK